MTAVKYFVKNLYGQLNTFIGGIQLKSIGIVRRIDDLGRVVIPKSLRYTLGISTGDELEISVDGKRVIIERYDPNQCCALCGHSDNPLRSIFPGKNVCIYCIGMIHKNEAQILRESALV